MIGIIGEKGWYGLYGTAPALQGVFKPPVWGPLGLMLRSRTVVFVVGTKDGDWRAGSKERRGRAREEELVEGGLEVCTWRGLGAGRKSGVCDVAEVAEDGSPPPPPPPPR